MTKHKKLCKTKIYPVVTTVKQGMFYLKRGDILIVDEKEFWLNIRKIKEKFYVFIGYKRKDKKIECFSTSDVNAVQRFLQFLLKKHTIIYAYLQNRRHDNV